MYLWFIILSVYSVHTNILYNIYYAVYVLDFFIICICVWVVPLNDVP